MYLRKDLYAKEASALLRIVTMYRVVLETQIYRFFPGKDEVIKKLLNNFVRQGRIEYCPDTRRYAAASDDLRQIDHSLQRAIWVLVDFIAKVEFHTPSDYPTKVVFFADSEMYEIIHIPFDSEILVRQALLQRGEFDGKRIIIVDVSEQIKNIDIPAVAGFCTVGEDGSVQYYKFQ